MRLSKIIINSILSRINRDHVNVLKTIIINFLFFSLKDALKFPILIYGPCKFGGMSGCILIKDPLKFGMIKIGLSDPVRSFYSKSYLSIEGVFYLSDGVVLRRGLSMIVRQNAVLKMNKNVFISDNNTIFAWDHIEIGEGTRVGNNTTFMDTDFHYILNTETGVVHNNHLPIIIGKNNWLGGNCIIKKGTRTPDGTILAGPYSMMSKDYTDIIPDYSIIAGCPAKLIKSNYRRINNDNSDIMITNHFKEVSDVYLCKSNFDKFCTPL